ncbi:3-dehydroquinate synthase [Schaalia vaccimaxillae]|uniref:3-dehydroquinate synthase n=1 Tax=Schaalia vaccimaxillae TaxID=183916 RepID=UPI0003B36DC6|nr:3-dehydroquinate synthase [Schaalia vaccimaxillae]
MSQLTLPIVMVGLPGAGKSKVGRLLAHKLGVAHIDTDDLIESDAGKSISEIFTEDGEAAFRQLEVQAVSRALTMDAVVSLGGGAVVTPRVRELLASASVVHIDVEHEELLRRTSRKTHRPLLREDPDGALKQLREQRSPLYAEVETVRVHSDSGPAEQVVEAIAAMVVHDYTRVQVQADRPYDVLVGRGFNTSYITQVLRSDATKVLVIHAPALQHQAELISQGLRAGGYEVLACAHPDAEAAKTIDVVAQLWDQAGTLALGRADAVVALGGGATTDMAGFVAATWLRGIDVINVPTTLLAMVDAAVGGKTGINTRSGKNLVGSFHTPARVVCDLDFLATLPAQDLRAGLGEVIKCGFIADPQILELVQSASIDDLLTASSAALRELVVRAIRVKANVVGQDLQESGLREILNYGHTLAHAIERCEGYTWRHGEAVSVGCVFAARLAQARGLIGQDLVTLHEDLFSKVGLPMRYEGGSVDRLIDAMGSDKKVRAGVLRFVLLHGLSQPATHRVDPNEVREVIEQVLA